jgi:putative phage-type endonuclease
MNAPERLQGTAAWFAERTGCLTASRMADAMDVLKSGKESAARRALKIEILAERLTGDVVPHFVTGAMQHGIDTEPAAKAAYSAKTGALITEQGFIRHASIEHFGASPDGRLDAKTGIEIKCPTTPKHLAWLLAGEVPAEHKPQMIAQCVCAKFESVEFVSYDPRMPERLRLFVVRFTPTADERAAVEKAAQEFLAEVEEMFQQLTTTEPA